MGGVWVCQWSILATPILPYSLGFPATSLFGWCPQLLPVLLAPGFWWGSAPTCFLLPYSPQGQVPLTRAAPGQAAGVSMGQGEWGLGKVAGAGLAPYLGSEPCLAPQCNQLFELLQDLVDHVNDHHVKPEQDARYCCHWEGCARHGRGFNAR